MKVHKGLLFFFILLAALSAVAIGAETDRTGSLSITGEVPAAKIEKLPWGRDLFVPFVSATKAPPMRLKAIFYNKKNPSAIIDDHIVYRGSVIKGFRVVEITETGVILRGGAGPLRLEITSLPDIRAQNGESKK